MADEKVEKEFINSDNPEEPIQQEEVDDFDIEEVENPLTLKHIISLVGAGIAGLLLFVLFLFPIEEIIRFVIGKSTQNSGYVVDFKKLNFPIFSEKSIDSLYFLTRDNIEIKAEEIHFTVDVPELYNGNIFSHIESFSSSLETDEFQINSKSLILDMNLIQSERENPVLNGGINISIGGGKIQKIPSFPVLGDLSGSLIKSIAFMLKKNGNRISIEKGLLDLSIAKITLRGRLDLSPSFKNSRMDMEICPKLSKEFATERQDLADMLTLLSKDGKEACIPLQGTFAEPKLIINMSLPGSENPPNTNTEPTRLPP